MVNGVRSCQRLIDDRRLAYIADDQLESLVTVVVGEVRETASGYGSC